MAGETETGPDYSLAHTHTHTHTHTQIHIHTRLYMHKCTHTHTHTHIHTHIQLHGTTILILLTCQCRAEPSSQTPLLTDSRTTPIGAASATPASSSKHAPSVLTYKTHTHVVPTEQTHPPKSLIT